MQQYASPQVILNLYHIMRYAKIAISRRDGSLMVKKLKIKCPLAMFPKALTQLIRKVTVTPTDQSPQKDSRKAVLTEFSNFSFTYTSKALLITGWVTTNLSCTSVTGA